MKFVQTINILGSLARALPPRGTLHLLLSGQHLVKQTAVYIDIMQKSMRLINIRQDTIDSDITGKSGLNIIELMLVYYQYYLSED